MAIIGFIIVFLFALGTTLLPILMIGLSGLGGGMKKTDWVICVWVWVVSCFTWVSLWDNCPFSVVVN